MFWLLIFTFHLLFYLANMSVFQVDVNSMADQCAPFYFIAFLLLLLHFSVHLSIVQFECMLADIQ